MKLIRDRRRDGLFAGCGRVDEAASNARGPTSEEGDRQRDVTERVAVALPMRIRHSTRSMSVHRAER
jgi:hypothetical protein